MANPAPGCAKKPEHRVDLCCPNATQCASPSAARWSPTAREALRVEETGHGPVHYIPEKDVRLDLMQPTEHTTYCPFKGDASYWTIDASTAPSEKAVRERGLGLRDAL